MKPIAIKPGKFAEYIGQSKTTAWRVLAALKADGLVKPRRLPGTTSATALLTAEIDAAMAALPETAAVKAVSHSAPDQGSGRPLSGSVSSDASLAARNVWAA